MFFFCAIGSDRRIGLSSERTRQNTRGVLRGQGAAGLTACSALVGSQTQQKDVK